MPIGTPVGNLDIANATLRTSNLETQNIKIGSIFVNSYPGLETTANVGNSMSNTIQFTNTHTAFTTTGNVTVGKELTVTGNATVSKDLTVSGNTFSTLYKGGRTTFLTWDYLGQRSTFFSAAGNTGGSVTQVNILDNTFDIPSCYHHLGTANLKAYVKIDWRGESQYSWNFGFTIEVTYNGNQIVYSSSSDHSSTSGNKINGFPCISADFTNFDSTPTAASVTSMFSLPNCDVSSGSQLKVQLVGKHGDSGTSQTLWTGRTKGFVTTSPAHELPITSFFVVLDVEDGY